MPRNGSGTFTRTHDWTDDAGTPLNIEASRFDTHDDDIASALTASLAKDGQTTPTANLPMGGFKLTGLGDATSGQDTMSLRMLSRAAWLTTTVASASTCDIGAVDFEHVTISGTTTITSFGTSASRFRLITFSGALTLTHNGTTLILPGATNIVTAANDCAIAVSDATGNWRVLVYEPYSASAALALETAEATVASAATTDLGALASFRASITGTTTITSFGSSLNKLRWFRFTGALTLTHNATSLILPGGANITTAAGDTGLAFSDASGNWRVVWYQKATGKSVIAPALSDVTATGALGLAASENVASAATCNIGAAVTNLVSITGTTTITAFDTVAAGIWRLAKFAAALTLTHNATTLILPGAANITTAANDTALMVSEGSGNWRCWQYTKASGQGIVSSGGITLLATSTPGAVATVSFTDIPETYAFLVVTWAGVSATTAVVPNLVVSTNNGSSYDTTAANYNGFRRASPATAVVDISTATLVTAIANTATELWNGSIIINGYQTGLWPMAVGNIETNESATNGGQLVCAYIGSSDNIDAVQIKWSGAGNFDAGTLTLHGVS